MLQSFQIESWWLVARLESYTPATFDDNITDQMAAELFEQWVKEETSLTMRDLQLAGTGTTTA